MLSVKLDTGNLENDETYKRLLWEFTTARANLISYIEKATELQEAHTNKE